MIPISAAKRTDGVRYAIRDVVMKAREHAADGMEMLYMNIGDPIHSVVHALRVALRLVWTWLSRRWMLISVSQ